jgi:peptidyl-prolyl cis-trans isomerase C
MSSDPKGYFRVPALTRGPAWHRAPGTLLTCGALLLAAGAWAADNGQVVLTVNGTAVHRWQLDLAQHELIAQSREPAADSHRVMRRALDEVVGATLAAQAATEAGVSVTDKDVDASLAREQAMAGQGKSFADELRDAGITDAERARFERERVLIGRFVETKIAPTVSVSEQETKRYYTEHPGEFHHADEVHLWMIMIPVPPGSPPGVDAQARKRAEAALARLKAGEEFSKVAADVSHDDSTAHAGLVGWVHRGLLLPELDPVIFALRPGDISGVVRSLRGYHVMMSDGHRAPGVYAFDEIRTRLEQALRGRKIDEAMAALVKQRRAKAVIVGLDPTVRETLAEEAPSPAR